MGINFGDLEADKVVDTATKVVTPKKPRKDYKKMYDELQSIYADTFDELTELKVWAKAVKKEEKETYELKDEIHRLTVQGNMDKKALDHALMKLSNFQFKPQKFSQLAQLLTYIRVHGNKNALIRVKEIVGTTELGAVRKWIFDLLEAPYK